MEYNIEYSRTGSWFADENSRWFDKHHRIEKGTAGCLCTWNNLNVVGKTVKSNEKFVQTSPCVFIVYDENSEKGWCYTANESLYCLTKAPNMEISFF